MRALAHALAPLTVAQIAPVIAAICAPTPDAAVACHAWLVTTAAREGCLHGPLPPLVRGRDLIDLGMAPGPRLGAILDAVTAAQIAGAVRDRQAAIALAQRMMADATPEGRA